jgi:hypothetical protein
MDTTQKSHSNEGFLNCQTDTGIEEFCLQGYNAVYFVV